MNYEQLFFDFVTKLHNNLHYCIAAQHNDTWVSYKFVNGINIDTEHFYYDGYYGIDFKFDGFRMFLMDDCFYFVDLAEEDKDVNSKPAIDTCYDGGTDIVDKYSYFQYSITHDLKGIRWQTFLMIKEIRDTFFEGYSTRNYLENGFKFIV